MPRRLKLRSRLILLLGGLVLVFVAAAWFYGYFQQRAARRIYDSVAAERSGLLDRVLSLRSQSLQNFSSDYSLWDDMVRFVREPDRAWAAINIDASLATFNAQAAWVLDADWHVIYSAIAPDGSQPRLPADDPGFREALRTKSGSHFFQATPDGLFEFRTGSIVPSDDVRRQQTPRGWFVVARLWNDKELNSLSETLQSRASVGNPPEGDSASTIHLDRELPDWRGQTVATLHVVYDSPPLALVLSSDRGETALFAAFGLVTITAVAVGISHWILPQVRQLSEVLETGRSEPLASLLQGKDEFAHLARQAAHSLVQRDALRESAQQLREGIEVRSRLARDLHDGIIQSIYAVGLGLESYRMLMQTDPEAATRRLATCQRMLNDTLWEVRNFIAALEPEAETHQPPGKSLESLVNSMQQLQSVALSASVDHRLAERLTPNQEMQVLQIARELLSNALRHAGASQVRITLEAAAEGQARLEVADDGTGFVPAECEAGGRGLRNVTTRARELGGAIAIDSSPGKGARIAVHFPLTA